MHTRISEILDDHMVGMYVVGSLALGDFDPQHSDIDIIVVTDTPIEGDGLDRIRALHNDFAASDSAWAKRVEAVYPEAKALIGNPSRDEHYPQIERDTSLFTAPFEDGWVFQRYTLREHGLVVAGPEPHTLVGPIDPHDMRAAVAVIAAKWLEQARNDLSWLEWVRLRHAQVFVLQTLCRMLYSLETGGVASKPKAVQWAQGRLDEKWARLIEEVLARRESNEEISSDELRDTIALIQHVFQMSQTSTPNS
ncbi:MAG: DUF4111 domain-containing protein [Anaerolineae bacterium]|nr:DUF4111 domain-containing protein [Anaerolineae bacterium]